MKLTKEEKKWLAVGTKIEMEHKLGKAAARRIALQHMSEFPGAGYYPELIKMEKKLAKKVKEAKK
jgi:hypothetical protein